ncbi:MAG: class I SAM-dependent DNA methyltransferase, partial [Kiritimatiellae bacterium]|nr:class I SAM-dependent DNA methyltransferase [Kiritimatiellia bacterium]
MQNTPADQKAAACQFVEFWQDKGYEKGQTQPFWLSLLRVLGVERPETAIEFEDKAHIDAAHGFIDGYIPETHVLVEQKSLGKNLRAAIPQSDGSLLTPFQQAKRYAVDLPYSRRPRWVVTCNFAEFLIYDMERPNAEPESLLLENLPDELHRLRFLVYTASDTIRHEEEISKRAGDVVGQIYDALLKQYRDPSNPESLKSLNELCVRIVFLLYAEDADVFRHLQFHDYLAKHRSSARSALIDLFRVLDTPPEKRDPYLDADLAAFPYVNGGLFANEHVEIPQFTEEIIDLILHNGSENFDWKDISPTIFGAVFESTLNPETRRSGGMHYTSVANIHKVIDPLFLDGLRAELAAIEENVKCKIENVKLSQAKLLALQEKLASLTFLDPACGSGNFLTETYISLRRLENRILAALVGPQGVLDFDSSILHSTFSTLHSRLVRVS